MSLQAIMNFLKSNPSLIPALAALIFSILSFKWARRGTFYSDIDGRYMDLLKLAIDNPSFVNRDLTRNYKESFCDEELLKYELYAFASWNIVETIYDRRKDRKLFKTWKPVIKEENRLHRTWLNNEENQHKFKNEFWKALVVKDRKDFPCPECRKLEGDSFCPRRNILLRIAESEPDMPLAITG